MISYLLVRVAGQRYGLPVGAVRQVLDIETILPAPGRHPAFLGVIARGATLLPLVHLAMLLGRKERASGVPATAVVTDAGRTPVALGVEDAEAVIRNPTQPRPSGWDLPWARGVDRDERGIVPIIDPTALVERLAQLSGRVES